MKNKALLLSLVWLTCGCGAPLVKDSKGPKENEAIFIFGLQPSNYKVQVFPGSIGKDGRFNLSPVLGAVYNGTPDFGYAVGKASPGNVLAITRVYDQLETSGSLIRPSYVPCGRAETFVFTPVAGK